MCNNHYDYVYLPYLDGFVGKNEYINKGYKKMLITLRFQAKEIDDGYAEVYVLTKKPTSKKN